MSSQRFIEIDLARTLAIVGMIVYHTAYDLRVFYGWNIDVFSGGWKIFQISIACLFLVLVGVSAAIANSRMATRAPHHGAPTPWLRSWKRFARIGMAALLVTVATYLIDAETYVRFGILHLIAVSTLLLPAITSWTYRRSNQALLHICIAMISIGIGSFFIDQWHINGHWRIIGIPLGILPEHFTTVDYFPLIPWFGVILMGYAMGHAAYIQYPEWRRRDVRFERLYGLMMILHPWATRPGHHSLLLYLIHQPIILAILWIVLGYPQS